MNKQGVAKVLADAFNVSSSMGMKGLNILLEQITKELEGGNKVNITGFGSFSLIKVPAHKGRNPFAGESMDVPEKNVIRFHQGTTLKQRINRK